MVLDSRLEEEDNLDKYMDELDGLLMEETKQEMDLPDAPTFQHEVEQVEQVEQMKEEEREAIAELAMLRVCYTFSAFPSTFALLWFFL